MNYETPGVYVEEKSIFPPSVAQVETAIPAFVGYTDEVPTDEPTKISSMLEYGQQFGGSHPQKFEVTLDDEEPYLPQKVNFDGDRTPYLMHSALQMFYANGGGPCYIVSVGSYNSSGLNSDNLSKGLEKIRKIDEVTLIVIPEAPRLSTEQDHYDLYNDVLTQCGELKDRFGIFDLRSGDKDASNFRNGIGTSYLSYGAAYYPFLNTSLPYNKANSNITFKNGVFDGLERERIWKFKKALDYQTEFENYKSKIDDTSSAKKSDPLSNLVNLLDRTVQTIKKALEIANNALNLVDDESFNPSPDNLKMAKTDFDEFKPGGYSTKKKIAEDGLPKLRNIVGEAKDGIDQIISNLNKASLTESDIKKYFTSQFESRLQNLLSEKRITLPPSSAIAGIYAKVDGSRGVWKSPANVSINRVSGPAQKLTLEDNDTLNVDGSGKSVNAIRAFTGKGTLVWGVRTLDGNSNEWRYISVRRFFNMVEESVKKSTELFVFEPNDANTWVKVKAMIENYLTLQWRAGALMGAKPKQAFFVKVGLGETMTQQDVLNGKMIVEIGMAVVRPVEFIILRFSHKMLES